MDAKKHFIIIKGRIPSKKNSRVQFYNKGLGRVLNIPSKEYTSWNKQASMQLLEQNYVNKDIQEVDHILLRFYFPDNRKADLSNKTESVMDLLVDNRVLSDDCWQVTGPLLLYPLGKDKENPRCEITITQKKG